MFNDQQLEKKLEKKLLSCEYIRRLVEAEGCFTFYLGWRQLGGRRYKMPGFVIAMNERDVELLKMIRDTMGLRNKIYFRKEYKYISRDGYKVGRTAVLVVREIDQLKDIIIPFFYKKLRGYKAVQFMDWLEKIGSDPDISDRFKALYWVYKCGLYDTLPEI